MTLDRMVFQFPRSSRECTRAGRKFGSQTGFFRTSQNLSADPFCDPVNVVVTKPNP